MPHELIVVSFSGFEVEPPWWSRTMIVSTPCCLSFGTSAFTVSSSAKATCEIPAGETISGVCSSVMPMMPTLTAGK